MTAFDRLAPALRYQIVHTLGIRELRPVQELTIDAVLDGKNCVVLAPTAGGKTEASFFPILSAMDTDDYRPVSVLYLSPIRALLNNQEARVARYTASIGRRAFKWHGDTPPGERKRFIADPADVLLTTPESLEAMMMSTKVPAHRLFQSLRAVIIDEVHAFAGSDRGAHLAAVMERLMRFCGHDLQRIGLSATVGNPDEILRWLAGNSQREGVVVKPPRPPGTTKLALDYVGSMANAALMTKALHPGKKRLVFVDSRRGVEELGRELRKTGVATFVTHGSLSTDERHETERAFQDGKDCVIVATSALELGIDIGDLDHVLQIDTPSTVSSFLQRMGRTGRRAGTVANCTFLVAREKMLLQAAALLKLHAEGYVEPVRPSRRAFHILAHQLLALCIQHGGLPRADWFKWLEGATPFTDITPEERNELVAHMLEKQILFEDSGKLGLGPEGEKLYGRRNFAELYAVFSTPYMLRVMWGEHEVGTVDASFLDAMDGKEGRGSFALAGRAWQILAVNWSRGECAVRPGENARAPRWSGSPQFLGRELCQAMKRVLLSDEVLAVWSERARGALAELRATHSFLRDEPEPIQQEGKGVTWWNFAGGRANVLLARTIEAEMGGECVVRNTSLTWKADERATVGALREFLRKMAEAGRPNRDDALRVAAESVGKTRVSKFEACLPDAMRVALLAESVVDDEGARRHVLDSAYVAG